MSIQIAVVLSDFTGEIGASMKKVIEGKLYNTETAKSLGERHNTYDTGDFTYCMEELFQTKSGAYFLFGTGGPMSKYARACGNNNWSGSSVIQPMSPTAAREWAEEHLTADEYSEAFGEPEEAGSNKEPLNISISPELKRRLTKIKEDTGKSISQQIEEKFSE
jgi:hypothetical protein